MEYALTQKEQELATLEEIKKALINDKKFIVSYDLLADFTKSLKKLTKASRESYYKGAKKFIDYCIEKHIDLVEEDDITNYVNYVCNNYKPATINLYLTSLRKFYKFLNKKGIKNLASDVQGVKMIRNFKKDPLTKNQAKELLLKVDLTTETGKRDFAILNLLLRTGLRTIEIERAKVEDLRTIGTKQLLQVQRKGHREKDDYVKLTHKTYEAIQSYLGARKNVKPSDPLFISYSDRTKGQNLKTKSIREIVKRYLRDAGINTPRITTHSLRHSAITFALLGGATLQEAQLLAGHENINTTLIYAHNIDKLNNDYEQKVEDYLEN